MAPGQESNRHRKLMRRALREARRAEGRTHPNPMVGCVIVREGEIVASGYHEGPGEAHAEVAALRDVEGETSDCDVYVNLEPCCHHGRTAPCTDALIEASVSTVYVGAVDPDPRMQGKGIERLEEAGIDVEVGLLEEESRRLNDAYVTYMTEGRPWVSVKWAMTLDGKIATREGDSRWITGEESRRRVHELRDRYGAIMVGTGTLKSDNPRLTSRIEGGRDPTRVVFDARLEASLDSNVYADGAGEEGPETIVVVDENAVSRPEVSSRIETLEARGVELLPVVADPDGRLPLHPVLESLAKREIVELFVEGGGRLVGSLFDAGLVDRVYAFVAPKLVGGRDAVGPNEGEGLSAMAEAPQLRNPTVERYGDDILVYGDLGSAEHGGE